MNLAVDQFSKPGGVSRTKRNAAPLSQAPFDLAEFNRALVDAAPIDIIQKSLDHFERPVLSTSFSAYSAALLHMVHTVRPDITVLWCDTGFNTPATYRFAEQLIDLFDLNIKIFVPQVSAARLEAQYNGVPQPGTEAHDDFTQTVKLEPFARAFEALTPDLWITGIRREETEYRKSQDIFTWDSKRAVTKLAPTFHLSSLELVDYLQRHDLPSEPDYNDPTKPEDNLECGLHY